MWFFITVFAVFGLLLWLPVQMDIDTRQELYRVRWRGIAACWCIPEAERWRWYFRLFFWQWEWRAGTSASKPEKKRVNKPERHPAIPPKRRPLLSLRQGRAILKQVLRAVRLERLRINWDTGDFVLNAWLYPAFQLASRGRRQLSINFMGEQELAICLQTRLGAVALAGLRVFLILKR